MRACIVILSLAVVAFGSAALGEEIGSGLAGPALRQHLRLMYSPTSVLGYRQARERMFRSIDDPDEDDVLTCVYTGTPFTTIAIPDASDVNTEHTWPQSRFDGAGMKSDLHHLFPTYNRANQERSNKRFAELDDDAQTSKWCGPGNTVSDSRTGGLPIDEYSESSDAAFEPREAHKGNVARALFYFAVIYEQRTIDMPWFASQVPTLLTWHAADPVDHIERDRSARIATEQGNQNPFVVDPSLVARVFAGGVPSDDPEAPHPPSPLPPAQAALQIMALLPNPDGDDDGRESVTLGNSGSGDTDLTGWMLRDRGGNQFTLRAYPKT